MQGVGHGILRTGAPRGGRASRQSAAVVRPLTTARELHFGNVCGWAQVSVDRYLNAVGRNFVGPNRDFVAVGNGDVSPAQVLILSRTAVCAPRTAPCRARWQLMEVESSALPR